MSNSPLRFALFGKRFQDNKSSVIQKILTTLAVHQAKVYVDRSFFEYISQSLRLRITPDGVFDGSYFDADFVIAVGGDGTFLRAASRVGDRRIPILGINTGRLGFLVEVLPSEIEDAINALFAGEYYIEEHSVIQVRAEGENVKGYPYAVNDVAVLKRDDAAMISIHTCVNGEHLVTYQADGLIVATPTGSTAYNLSNGGPIMVPDSHCLCLTPVAPHSLNIRSIVVNDDSEIEVDVESRSHNFLVAVDGRSEKMVQCTKLHITKAPFPVCMVKRRSQRYFSTLREKLMWGADQRQ